MPRWLFSLAAFDTALILRRHDDIDAAADCLPVDVLPATRRDMRDAMLCCR